MSTKCFQISFTNSYQRNAKYYFYTTYISLREKTPRYVYALWWTWWCLLIIDNSILACPDRMFSARIMLTEVPPHRGLSGTGQAGRKCLMMAAKLPSNGSASETTREVPALAALAYPKPKNKFEEGVWVGSLTLLRKRKVKEVWKNFK